MARTIIATRRRNVEYKSAREKPGICSSRSPLCVLTTPYINSPARSLSLSPCARTREEETDETSVACAAVRLRESANTVETAREGRRPLPPQRSTEIAERGRAQPAARPTPTALPALALRSDPRSGGTGIARATGTTSPGVLLQHAPPRAHLNPQE